MVNVIVVVVLLVILALAAAYVIRAKKRGEKCVGCPYARECARRRQGGCGGS